MSATLTQHLATLLSEVERPGNFYATGTLEVHAPRLEVEGLGPVALPLLPLQAEQLIARAEQAPYGRGTETLVDPQVRRTWQIGAERVRISGRVWEQDLRAMVAQVKARLGVGGTISAELYKLLIYDTGSFFIRHRDSEKAPGMFATLVVILPSDYGGGELLIRHRGQEVRLDLRREDPSEAAFAAFYADCLHEVLPVVSGYRLALIYNLIRTDSGPLPEPPDYDRQRVWAAKLLQEWGETLDSAHPEAAEPVLHKLIYPLEHAYTPAEIAFDRLKGADAAVAGVLVPAAHEAGCDIHLALVSIEESGWAEHIGGAYWGEDDEDDFEIGEVDESRQTVADWRHPDGHHPNLGALPFDRNELSPPDAFDDLEPDELEFQEATGNEGASFERLYQRAALVLWPRSTRVGVVARGGLEATIPFLGDLAQRWQVTAEGTASPLWQEAHETAERIRRDWPNTEWGRHRASKEGATSNLLTHLTSLGDLDEIAAFVGERVAAGAYGQQDNPALVGALGHLTAARAVELLTAVCDGNAQSQPSACADLLARCVVADRVAPDLLQPAGLALLRSLPTAPPVHRHLETGLPAARPTATMMVDLLGALERIDATLAPTALEHALRHPDCYPMDGVLVPAALTLYADPQIRRFDSVRALRANVLDHLRRRIAEPLEPPADWRRPSAVGCTCKDCAELSRFLDDPLRPEWDFKAPEAARRHLEQSIRTNQCDLDQMTIKRSRPYTLRCKKNQASYQRCVEQRQRDLQHLASLDGDSGSC